MINATSEISILVDPQPQRVRIIATDCASCFSLVDKVVLFYAPAQNDEI